MRSVGRPGLTAKTSPKMKRADGRDRSRCSGAQEILPSSRSVRDTVRRVTGALSGDPATSLLTCAARLNDAHRLVHETAARRDLGTAEYNAWQGAAQALHDAYDEMYPRAFWEMLTRLQNRDAAAVEGALRFLEVDPWCFRSGYVKEWIAQLLKRHELTVAEQVRVERLLVHLVDVGDRREFSEFCKLARRNATPRLRAELRFRLASSDDDGVRRRALVMLTSLRHPRLTPAEVQVARDLILLNARRRDDRSRSANAWAERLAAQVSDDDWAEQLVSIAVSSDADRAAAFRVLGVLRGVHLSDEQQLAAARHVLSVIDTGEDESWFEGLTALADSAGFRDELVARANSADPGVARRLYWAQGALRRKDGRRAPSAENSGAHPQDPPPV
jgi:hypothetical protein